MGKLKFDYSRYRVPPGGEFNLSKTVTKDDQGVEKAHARKQWQENLDALQEYQERLYAEGKQSILLVLQA
ncbi:MAG: polyphosphate kinase 2 family protein, partial [Gammaproteobacteria bacterium]|nr:polyphosphate kinase 2 family protein [Gammaproteobacteria bacterium]